MQSGFKVFTIRGIDIYVHWSWLLAVAIITWSLGAYFHTQFPSWTNSTDYLVGLICAVLLFVTVLLHELAHSFTARANGLPVHTITLFIFGGVSNLTQEPQTPRIELLVAIAGPLTSLFLSGFFYALYALFRHAPSEVTAVLGYLASINLLLALFNLIPGFPLDGGRVLRAILWASMKNLRRATHIASNVGQAVGYLFILAGVLQAFAGGSLISGIWLALIGFFLQNSAQASYQQAVMDQVLRGVDVGDVMDTAPAPVPPNASLDRIVYDHMLGGNQRALPVVGPDGTLQGLVTLRDIQHVPRDAWPSTPVTEVMTRSTDLQSVTRDEDLRTAMQKLAENRYHQLPVMQDGRMVGLLDRSHVLEWMNMRRQIPDRAGGSVRPQGRL